MDTKIYPYIEAISYYLPDKVLTNYELNNIYDDWDEKKAFLKLGIKERHISSENEFVSDMAVKAAIKLFEEYNINPVDIDFIMLCTQSPDYILPTTACILQDRLGIPTTCGAFDFNLGCSGFPYGLALARSVISDGLATKVLLIMSETYSKHIHPMDKAIRPIFGDGASATLIKGECKSKKIGEFVLGTDGKGANNLIIHAGGMRNQRNDESARAVKDKFGNERSSVNIYMNGPEIYKFAINNIPGLIYDVLKKNDLQFEDIDLFVFHQASKYLLESLRDKLNIPNEKFYINLTNIGNTVSASIPIALKSASEEGKLKRGQKVMLAGFGVGYSWGGTVIIW